MKRFNYFFHGPQESIIQNPLSVFAAILDQILNFRFDFLILNYFSGPSSKNKINLNQNKSTKIRKKKKNIFCIVIYFA
jgi:hypothetical protein